MWHLLIPDQYRFLLDFVSPFMFKVISIKEAASKLSLFNTSLDIQAYTLAMHPWLPEVGILADPVSPADFQGKQALLGESILKMYFAQLRLDSKISLDLRSSRWSIVNSQIHFYPNQFTFTFDRSFREGLNAIYEGFYNQNNDLMKKGMTLTQLCPKNASPQIQEKCLAQIERHFGHNLAQHSFSLAQFKDSFHTFFCHLKELNIQIHSDFLFLGIYLFTLYQSLEETKQSYDVRHIYKQLVHSGLRSP